MRCHKHSKRVHSRHPSWIHFVGYDRNDFEIFMPENNEAAISKGLTWGGSDISGGEGEKENPSWFWRTRTRLSKIFEFLGRGVLQ